MSDTSSAPGMDDLRRAIVDGRLEAKAALDMLTGAHDRMFGPPGSELARAMRDGALAADLLSSGRNMDQEAPMTWLAQSVMRGNLNYDEAVSLALDRAMTGIEQDKASYENGIEYADAEQAFEEYRQSVEQAITYRLDVLLEGEERNHTGDGWER